ncbi:unnamed protein product [Brassica rapa]|uniref:Uncharacterized protein n=2 Tax=Brassica TaxID=3705 RepID=A0A3P6AZE6_BRACM|nr:unnamed protein product [Brassica napus]CAG7900459.1 unnamed protein product [Brassica rapa]CDY35894.1 BnaA07g00930D [Brassica napus]VDC95185.1 unnamed protein product [Brassica rapa]
MKPSFASAFMKPLLEMLFIRIQLVKADIIPQLQEPVNLIAAITFKAFGTLQRDAPLVQISPNYLIHHFLLLQLRLPLILPLLFRET